MYGVRIVLPESYRVEVADYKIQMYENKQFRNFRVYIYILDVLH